MVALQPFLGSEVRSSNRALRHTPSPAHWRLSLEFVINGGSGFSLLGHDEHERRAGGLHEQHGQLPLGLANFEQEEAFLGGSSRAQFVFLSQTVARSAGGEAAASSWGDGRHSASWGSG